MGKPCEREPPDELRWVMPPVRKGEYAATGLPAWHHTNMLSCL